MRLTVVLLIESSSDSCSRWLALTPTPALNHSTRSAIVVERVLYMSYVRGVQNGFIVACCYFYNCHYFIYIYSEFLRDSSLINQIIANSKFLGSNKVGNVRGEGLLHLRNSWGKVNV